MADGMLIDLWRLALSTLAWVGAPLVGAALAVGLVVSVFQAATQIQESILSVVPKLIAVALIVLLLGHFMLERLAGFTRASATVLVRLGREAGQ